MAIMVALLVGGAAALSATPGALSWNVASPVRPIVLTRPLSIPVDVDGVISTLDIAVEENPSAAAAAFLTQHGCARRPSYALLRVALHPVPTCAHSSRFNAARSPHASTFAHLP